MEYLFIISFAIVLAASTGIRAFLPITITAFLAKFNLIAIKDLYSTPFIQYITDDRVLLFLILATVIEILSDKIPAVDNFLDGVYTVIKPVIAFFTSYAVISANLEPWQNAIIAITLALSTTSVSMGLKGTVRLASTTTTAGTLNTIISFVEDILVSVKILLSMIFIWILPIMAFMSILLTIVLIMILFKVFRKKLREASAR